MNKDSIWIRIWRVIYPLIIYFLLDTIVVWMVETLVAAWLSPEDGSFLGVNTPALAGIIFLCISIPLLYNIYKRDYNLKSSLIYKKPQYIAVSAIAGALASHGFSMLVTFMNVDNIAGSYENVNQAFFTINPVVMIIYTVILAPVSEELLFRGIIYNRLGKYIEGFWIPALVSAAIFGVYHMNLAQGIFAFLFGLFSCAVYDVFRNLWAPIALHIGGNLMSVILTLTGVSYPQEWMGAIGMIIALAAAAAMYYFFMLPQKKLTVISEQ